MGEELDMFGNPKYRGFSYDWPTMENRSKGRKLSPKEAARRATRRKMAKASRKINRK